MIKIQKSGDTVATGKKLTDPHFRPESHSFPGFRTLDKELKAKIRVLYVASIIHLYLYQNIVVL